MQDPDLPFCNIVSPLACMPIFHIPHILPTPLASSPASTPRASSLTRAVPASPGVICPCRGASQPPAGRLLQSQQAGRVQPLTATLQREPGGTALWALGFQGFQLLIETITAHKEQTTDTGQAQETQLGEL